MKKIVLGIILASSLLFSYTMDFDRKTTCLVRQLKVYENPQWVSKIELNNGKKVFSPLQSRCLSFTLDQVNGLMLV